MQKRNYLVDNSKIICIFFTVFGHCLELFAPYNKVLLLIIYSFHMPIFILFSGYYAKYNLKKVIANFLIPYIVVEIITFIVYSLVEPTEFHIVHGYTSLWYLISLFFWYCTTKLLGKISHKKVFIMLTTFISLILGYDSSVNGILSISRTIVFFPIFAIGYFWGQKDYLNVRKKSFNKKVISIILFTMLCIALYIFRDKLDLLYFYGSMPYYDFYSPLIRLAIYVANAISINLFINIIPDKKLFFTFLGKNTFAVYILHYLILYLLYHCTVLVDFQHRTFLSLLLSINILLVLSNKYVMLYLKKVFGFISEKVFRFYYYLCE